MEAWLHPLLKCISKSRRGEGLRQIMERALGGFHRGILGYLLKILCVFVLFKYSFFLYVREHFFNGNFIEIIVDSFAVVRNKTAPKYPLPRFITHALCVCVRSAVYFYHMSVCVSTTTVTTQNSSITTRTPRVALL